MVTVPYDEIDAGVVELVRAFNAFPGVTTIGSCSGHDVPVSPMSTPPGEWWVTFEVAHSENGWRSLEFLAWAFRDMAMAELNVTLSPFAVPPWLNTPGRMLRFEAERLEVSNPRDEADVVAAWLNKMRYDYFIPKTLRRGHP